MKTILRLLMGLAIVSVSTTLHAQCTITNFSVTVKSLTTTAAGCQMVVDVKFTGDFNNGNKYAFVHIWESAPLNKYPNLTYANPPTAAQLTNALATIVIQEPGKNSAALYNQYPPNTTVPVVFTGVTFSKTGSGPYNFTLANVKLLLTSCDAAVTIKGDTWASQADNSQVVHCYIPNSQFTYQFNNPVLDGLMQCAIPRRFNVSVNNTQNSSATNVTYNVYADGGTLGIRDAGDVLVAGPSTINVGANQTVTTPYMSYNTAYSATTPWANRSLLIDATATSALQTITYSGVLIGNTCSLLPVQFKSFAATRNGRQVLLQWETASEQNNKGFYLQRSSGGAWKDIGLVFPQTEDGNSTIEQGYSFTDINPSKTVSQYRILQVDFDGKGRYSETRAVRGETGGKKLMLFPNPSTTGAVTLLFDAAGSKDITVTDVAGRVLQQHKNVTGSSLELKNIPGGFYTISVRDGATGTTTVEKIIIKKR